MPENSYFGPSRMAPKDEPGDNKLENSVARLDALIENLKKPKDEESSFGLGQMERDSEALIESPLLKKKQ